MSDTVGALESSTGIEDRIALLISEAVFLHMQASGISIASAICLDDIEAGRTSFALALIALAERFDADAAHAHGVH